MPKLLRTLALLDQEALDNTGTWLLACAALGTFCAHWRCLKRYSHPASECEPVRSQTQCSNFILNSRSHKWLRKADSRIMRHAVFLEKLKGTKFVFWTKKQNFRYFTVASKYTFISLHHERLTQSRHLNFATVMLDRVEGIAYELN